jgi:hypothetical protein
VAEFVLPAVIWLTRGAEATAQSPSRLRHKEQCKREVSLRRSGATLPLGLQGTDVSNDTTRDGVIGVALPSPDSRRGVGGTDGATDASRGGMEEARDREGEQVVEDGTEGTRDQPNSDVRMEVDDGSGARKIGCSSSDPFSEPVLSLVEGSVSTDAMTAKSDCTCVEDCTKVIRS